MEEIITPTTDVRTRFKSNFYQYGMSVIEDRALPDIRDGLKPVQRAILFEMLNSGYTSNKKTVKVKKVVGAIIGNWHPHGDGAVEDAMTTMAQPWSNSLPPIFIKGNGGSIFGDDAADGRYIETRLTPAGDAYGYKLKKGIVPYVPNFDDTDEMPSILPAQLPYLLINGINEGIAVGVAASLPPHNPVEVLKMTLQYMKDPKTKTEDLLKIMPGPDFPSGATIINQEELLRMYETGGGDNQNSCKIRIRATIEYDKKEHELHVTEIPYLFAGSMDNLVTELALATTETLNGKKKVPPKITGINAVNNYSGKKGIDICLELAKGVDPEEMKRTLFAKTRLETTIKFNFHALNEKILRRYSLRQYLAEYTEFQHEIITREHELEQQTLEERLEVIVGRIIASQYIDEIVDVVRNSNGAKQVKDVLKNGTILAGTKLEFHKTVETFRFTERQADAIAEMKLYQLNKLDTKRLQSEGKEIQTRLKTVTKIVTDRKTRHKLIIKRLQTELDKLPEIPRKTRIISDSPAKASDIELPTIPLFLQMDHYGYVRIEGKPFESGIETTNKSRIGFFDTNGNCWNLFLDRTKETKDRGTLISQLIPTTDRIVGFTTGITSETKRQGLFLMKGGCIKRMELNRLWTKTRATKVTGKIDEESLIAYYDIPEDVNIVEIDGIDYPLDNIPLQAQSGKGNALLTEKDEPYTVTFKQGTVQAAKKKNTTFDAVVTFTKDGQLLFDWDTLDVTEKEGLYVTTYQQLLKDTLLFIHADGTAKRVKGTQFAVKTKRTQIVADKEGSQILLIQPDTETTLVGVYTNGKQKRIDASKISIQSKLGGGIRVFYSSKDTLDHVESGEQSKLPIVSFATLPKEP